MQEVAAQSASAIAILVVLTVSQMILGELVPKSLALQFPTPVALYTVLPMQWSIRLLSWFIAVLNGSGHAILRLLGVPHTGHVHIHTPEEIEYLIAESREGGLFEPDEHARLREALRLGVTSVNEVMVPRTGILGIRANAPFPEMLRIAEESPYTRLPVFEGTLDHVIGYVHVQDIVRGALTGGEPPPLRPILVLPEGMTLERLLERLRAERQHMALIADEYGGTAGLVTIGDILDEIMGGVADEFKPADPSPEELPDGRVRLPGSLRLHAAAELLGADWEGESSTVGGFVAERLGRVPASGRSS
jgi:putative hemolysin